MALNDYRIFCCYDFETTGINPHGCQLTQISALMIDAKKLTPIKNGFFNTEVRPEFDDEVAKKNGFDPVEQKALDKTKKNKEDLLKAPLPKVAWKQFTDFISRFNSKGDAYWAPIPVGYNINGYDSHIVQRYANLFGPVDKNGKQKLLHQIYKVDMMDMLFSWFEHVDDIQKLNMDYIRAYLGFPEESTKTSHDAAYDVIDTANIFIRFMKFQRAKAMATKFEKSFANTEMAIKYEDVIK